jgi:NAD(P)H-flavin reductase
MIAGGAGIAPMFQLIQLIANSNFLERNTGISLIYATKIVEDIAFLEDLANYDAKGKISFFPVVEMPNSDNWNYGTGLITTEMVHNLMPSPNGKINFEDKFFFSLIAYKNSSF